MLHNTYCGSYFVNLMVQLCKSLNLIRQTEGELFNPASLEKLKNFLSNTLGSQESKDTFKTRYGKIVCLCQRTKKLWARHKAK